MQNTVTTLVGVDGVAGVDVAEEDVVVMAVLASPKLGPPDKDHMAALK